MLTVVDRIPTFPGRILITPENGDAPYFASISRADEPSVIGTPINKTLFDSIQEDISKTIRVVLPENEIPNGVDLNDYKQPGSWTCSQYYANGIKNYPRPLRSSDSSFRLTVYAHTLDGDIVQHIVTCGGYTSQRVFRTDKGWQPWAFLDPNPWIYIAYAQGSAVADVIWDIPKYRQLELTTALGFAAEVQLFSPVSNGTYSTLEFHFLNNAGESIGFIPFAPTPQSGGTFQKGYLHSINSWSTYSVAREPTSLFNPQVITPAKPAAVRDTIAKLQVRIYGGSTQVNLAGYSVRYRRIVATDE